MKKFLASLLSLTMLCSSAVVLCSAQEGEGTNNNNSQVQNEDSKEQKDNNQGINPSNKENIAIIDFCVKNAKHLAIASVVMGVATIVGTTVYVYRNVVKDLAQKAAKLAKNVSEKVMKKVNKSEDKKVLN